MRKPRSVELYLIFVFALIAWPALLFNGYVPHERVKRIELKYENCKIELAHSQQQWELFRKERDECLRTEVCPACGKRHNEGTLGN